MRQLQSGFDSREELSGMWLPVGIGIHFSASRESADGLLSIQEIPADGKGYARQLAVRVWRPLSYKSKLSRKPHPRIKHHVSANRTEGRTDELQ